MGKKSLGEKPHEQLRCPNCKEIYKNYMLMPGRKMITHICKCNTNLINEAAQRMIDKQKQKENLSKGIKTLEVNL